MTKEKALEVAQQVLRDHGITPAQWRFTDRPVKIECLATDPRGGMKKIELPVKRSWSEKLFREVVINQLMGA